MHFDTNLKRLLAVIVSRFTFLQMIRGYTLLHIALGEMHLPQLSNELIENWPSDSILSENQ